MTYRITAPQQLETEINLPADDGFPRIRVGIGSEKKVDLINYVTGGVTKGERVLVEKGMSPKEAREVSMYRVFGGVNGNYGTGIQEMVTAGDRWDKESQIAEVYMNNMGAFYGDEKNWETFRKVAFEAALTRTDVVVQPRQSNTWGALSLDHVYEFMGGMNLAVRNVTGKDPDATGLTRRILPISRIARLTLRN